MDGESGLIRRIQKYGSRKAADLLVRGYYEEIYVCVCRQVGNREDAMDLTQEIFIAALQSVGRYDSKKSAFRTWLHAIAAHKVIDRRRAEHVTVLALEDDAVQEGPDELARLDDAELLRRIEVYVSGFDEETQTVFRLHVYDGCSFREIAESLNMPEASVKTKYYRLQKRIREEFGNDR